MHHFKGQSPFVILVFSGFLYFVVLMMIFFNIVLFARWEGGREAEKAERDRWINKERQKILDSVEGIGCVQIRCAKTTILVL